MSNLLAKPIAEPKPWNRVQEGAVELSVPAHVPLQPGQEVCISYGDKNNRDLVAQYGFVLPGNAADRLRLPCPAAGTLSREHLLRTLRLLPGGNGAEAARCVLPTAPRYLDRRNQLGMLQQTWSGVLARRRR